MTKLAEMFNIINVDPHHQIDVVWGVSLILCVQRMSDIERNTLRAVYKYGPVRIPDVCRKRLISDGLICSIGKDGYNACTLKGKWAYKLIEADLMRKNSHLI